MIRWEVIDKIILPDCHPIKPYSILDSGSTRDSSHTNGLYRASIFFVSHTFSGQLKEAGCLAQWLQYLNIVNLGTVHRRSLCHNTHFAPLDSFPILSFLPFNAMAYKLYNYDPSGGAAIPFAALFGLATVIHIVQMIHARSWYMIPFTIGGVCKVSHDILEGPSD